MLVSWLQRLSLLDYPGKVACVVFTLGCNLRCGFCQNSEFVLPEKIAHIKDGLKQTEEFFDFLKIRQWILDWVSVCGGEPTIHTDLPNFLTRIKSLGFKVKLDTNGRNPKMLQELISRGLVDYVAMDIKHTWGKYASIVGKNEDIAPYKESVRIIMQQAPEYEFRTTVIGGDIQSMILRRLLGVLMEPNTIISSHIEVVMFLIQISLENLHIYLNSKRWKRECCLMFKNVSFESSPIGINPW